jgi:glycoside/pentoside/hexuronide:cation symporter, GPH family
VTPASVLLGITGTVWAITALVAVFPLNWLSKRFGKRTTLIIAILLMCAAQIAKIFCYRPGILFQFDLPKGLLSDVQRTITIQAPYLILIPTTLLSAGMLMFFTLGSSMVGDVCDEDELKTGTRTEGTYYSVFWWFIKVGSAFASVVTGALLVFAGFDEKQNVAVDALQGSAAVIKAEAEEWQQQQSNGQARVAKFNEQLEIITKNAEKLRLHFDERIEQDPDQTAHVAPLIERIDTIRSEAELLRGRSANAVPAPAEIIRHADELLGQTVELKKQTPKTLFRLRLVEIGLPLALSCVSILLTLRYPLTEERCYEIKEALKKRHAEAAS